MIDKNSAPSKSHSTAERKKQNTRLTADKTGFEEVMTLMDVNINSTLKIKKVINSMFIAYYFLCLLSLVAHTCRLF